MDQSICGSLRKNGKVCKSRVRKRGDRCWWHKRLKFWPRSLTLGRVGLIIGILGLALPLILDTHVRDSLYSLVPSGKRYLVKRDISQLSKELAQWNPSCEVYENQPDRHDLCEGKIEKDYQQYYAKRLEYVAAELRAVGKQDRELEDRVRFSPFTDGLVRHVVELLDADANSLK